MKVPGLVGAMEKKRYREKTGAVGTFFNSKHKPARKYFRGLNRLVARPGKPHTQRNCFAQPHKAWREGAQTACPDVSGYRLEPVASAVIGTPHADRNGVLQSGFSSAF